jgi:PAS domain S-box-containing protein
MAITGFNEGRAVWAAQVSATVFLLGLLGIMLQREAQYISSLWPANAMAMGLLLIRPQRDWSLGVGGVLVGNIALNILVGNDFWSSAGYSGINGFEILLGAFVIGRCIGLPVKLSRLKTVGIFVFCAALMVPAFTAFSGAAMGRFLYGAEYWPAWRAWWLADSLSVMIFAPLALSLPEGLSRLRGEGRRVAELILLVAITLAVTGLTFSSPVFPLVYLTFPFLLIAGARFGFFGLGLNSSLMALLAVWVTIQFPVHHDDLARAIIETQTFLGVTVLAGLAVTAVLSENRATISKLASSEGKFRQLVEHASDAIFVHDMEGNFVDVNYQACKTLGYERDELLALNVRDVEVSALATGPDDSIWPRLREGVAVTVNGAHRRKDGSTFPVEVRIGLLTHESTPMIVAMARDVTERRLAEDQLLKAKEEAEQASRAKSVFLANTSHELRTPLNAIIGYSELLEEETVEHGHYEYALDLSRIKAAGRHLLDIITGILDLSKVEAGKMEVDLVPLKLASLMEDVRYAIEPMARQNGNRLKVACDPAIGEIISDPVKLRQIFINLLSNAAKFTSDGEIGFYADLKTRNGGTWLRIRVEDTGIGIAPEKLNTLFEAFTQADSSTTRRFGGTGLGLAISRRYSELLNGTLRVESQPGAGTVFTLDLPWQSDLQSMATG